MVLWSGISELMYNIFFWSSFVLLYFILWILGVIISRYAFKSSCKCPSRYNNMVREGLWPLSLGGQPSFVTFGLIDMCSQLLSACPSLSYAALSQALSNICMRKTLNVSAFLVIDLHHHTSPFYSHCFMERYRLLLPFGPAMTRHGIHNIQSV